ncbi:Tyrosine recombinase XerC [Mycolicibacterium aubagnense]
MGVTKRGGGWQVDFQLGGVRYQPAVFETQEAAEKWEFDTRQALKAGRPLPAAPVAQVGGADTGTVKNALRAAKEKRWAYKPGSTRTVLNAETFVDWVGENTPANVALSEDKIHEFVQHLMNVRKVSNSTVNRYLSAISVLIEYARVAKPKLPFMKKGKSRTRFFTEEEVALVIQTLTIWGKHHERDLFIFLVDTGARPYAEACALQWENLRDRRVTFVDTKNGDDRTLPLTTRALEAVERQRACNGQMAGPWTDVTEWQMIELWRGVRGHLTQLEDTVVYTARHTCASWQVIKGIDLMRVMKWMGHRSYQTTLGYAHLAPDHLMDNLTALEGGAAPKLMVINSTD